MTETIVEPHTTIEVDEDGNQRFTHIVNCPDGKEDTASWVTEARIMGLEVTALCGKKWVPQADPKKYPICQPCLTEASRLLGIG